VEHLASIIDDELKPTKDQPVLLHVNGFGATPLMELYLIYDLAAQFWEKRGHHDSPFIGWQLHHID